VTSVWLGKFVRYLLNLVSKGGDATESRYCCQKCEVSISISGYMVVGCLRNFSMVVSISCLMLLRRGSQAEYLNAELSGLKTLPF
jgi:hypothetical protein